MAAFFSSSAEQREAAGNMSFHDYSSSNPYPDASAGGLIPLPGTIVSQGSFPGVTDTTPPRLGEQGRVPHGDGRNEVAFMQTMDRQASSAEMGLQTQLLMLNEQPNAPAMQHQGLSLSLGTQIPVSLYQYRPTSPDASFHSPHQSTSANRNLQTNSSIQNSKYLKAARELLDEVVNVRDALKRRADKSHTAAAGTSDCKDADAGSKSEDKPPNPQESAGNSSAELSPSARQDLQNKVTALLAMLDQVDRRYRHYYHQMQIVMSSFDVMAGPGAAKPYTALALQTISRHFRALRDAISGQIQATRKSLGEQDTSSKSGSGISRLRYIDQQMRQQRAMQQFGMMQQHTWRPQRGLPESSVSILRAWLFEHFLHPYPKDSEKLMLARQTGLSRGQVSNWFINARVRLWKPMIEDMYREEFGAEIDSNSSSDNPVKGKDEARSSEDREEQQSPSTERNGTGQLNPFKTETMAGMDVGLSTIGFQNLDNSMNVYPSLNLNHQRPNDGDGSLLQDALAHHNNNARFMAYHMAELGGYDSSGVSLTLGLQHCNGALPGSAEQQGLLTVRGDDIYSNAGDFEYMNNPEDRQRFSSSQLLHDYVA